MPYNLLFFNLRSVTEWTESKGAKSFIKSPATTWPPPGHDRSSARNKRSNKSSTARTLRAAKAERLPPGDAQKGCKDDENDDILTDTTERHELIYVWIRRTCKTKKYLKNTAIQEFVFQSSCHQLCFIASRHLSLNLRLFHAATEIRVEMLPESTDASRSEFSLQWWQRGGNVGQAVLKCITTEPWTTQKHHHNTTYSDLQRSTLFNYWSCATKSKQIKVK